MGLKLDYGYQMTGDLLNINVCSRCCKMFIVVTLFIFCIFRSDVVEAADSSNVIWHICALGLVLGAIITIDGQKSQYNELLSKDNDLSREYQAATSSTEIVRITKEHEENKKKLTEYRDKAKEMQYVAGVAMIWEAYLINPLFSRDGGSRAQTTETQNHLVPKLALLPNTKSHNLALLMEWKF